MIGWCTCKSCGWGGSYGNCGGAINSIVEVAELIMQDR